MQEQEWLLAFHLHTSYFFLLLQLAFHITLTGFYLKLFQLQTWLYYVLA